MNSRRLLPVLAGAVGLLLTLALSLAGRAVMFPEGLDVGPDICCVIPGHLIVHPKGTLIWDVGMVPDLTIGAGGPGGRSA